MENNTHKYLIKNSVQWLARRVFWPEDENLTQEDHQQQIDKPANDIYEFIGFCHKNNSNGFSELQMIASVIDDINAFEYSRQLGAEPFISMNFPCAVEDIINHAKHYIIAPLDPDWKNKGLEF